MSKLFFGSVVALLLTACISVIEYIPEENLYLLIDFTKLTEQGMLITPDSYEGEYTAVGMIDMIQYPKAYIVEKTPVVSEAELKETPWIPPPKPTKQWVVEPPNHERILDSLYQMITEKGGDAITRVVISYPEKTYNSGTASPIVLTGIRIHGFAIKRMKDGE
ncbi:MAG: hypothetical protein ISR95_01035 [Candidatus Marinimicrobia bacterium]|nr:hypothetical protein [Candidatus Brocadiales bacterium]MBL7046215.1 hypothetical protein [Candidatus Neomarinimicrobiota bacterium]